MLNENKKESKRKAELRQKSAAKLTDYFGSTTDSRTDQIKEGKTSKQLIAKLVLDSYQNRRQIKQRELIQKEIIFGRPNGNNSNSKHARTILSHKSLLHELQSLKSQLQREVRNSPEYMRVQSQIIFKSRHQTQLKKELQYFRMQAHIYTQQFNHFQLQRKSKFYGDWQLIEGKYQTVQLLGKGGFSEVYLAIDLNSMQKVAVKMHCFEESFKSFVSLNNGHIRHAIRQFQIQQNLNHPNIVKLLKLIELDSHTFCTIMEYCDGKDLKNQLRTKGPFKEDQARVVLRQIFEALLYLHEHDPKVIHYDLKPGNIFTHQGTIKLSDFGLCKRMNTGQADIELTSFGCGTYYYLPPQCFTKDESKILMISEKVDIWSAGVILFELLYSRKPFGNGMSQKQIWETDLMNSLSRVQFPSTPEVTGVCKEFMRSCLCNDPQKRISAREALSHKFFK